MPNRVYIPITIPEFSFLSTRGELCYQEVLDCFPSAKKVTIITFNLGSSRASNLIRALERLDAECHVNIYHGIPNRFSSYWTDNARTEAKKSITNYLSILCFEQLPSSTRIFFCAGLHSKIIATESVMYIGSANYSDASAGNLECGILIKDRSLIESITSKMSLFIEMHSIERVHPTLYEIAISLESFRLDLAHFRAAINDLCIIPFDDYRQTEGWGLLPDMAMGLKRIVEEVEGVACNLNDVVVVALGDVAVKQVLANNLRELNLSPISLLLDHDGPLKRFLLFDPDEDLLQRMSKTPPGDEDHLHQDLASIVSDIENEHEKLTSEADVVVRKLLNELTTIENQLRATGDFIVELKRAEATIDNTQGDV